ncbi:hypothetical protein PVIIG_06301 [Plasmodium vivax India VII]|uniref:PIR Superfamily Protein n=1 Tax=Plasmodium vivax India VII TaxID=1077284 RepID=A0A0J9S350_PLAVI|nr:hypothetical protein PVIIG_06301 [Plasmodium vivax India VII]
MSDCEEDFRSLKSHTYYKIFHSYKDKDTCNRICEKLKNVFSSYQDFNSFCCKLSKNVVNVSGVLIDPTKNNELCTHLNYWLYDALIKKNFLDKTDKIYESKVIKELSGLWNSFYNNNKCKLEQYDMNVTDFNNMKVLSDYSQNYYGITEHLKDPDTQKCKKLYCSYINKIKDTYNDVSGSCSSPDDKPYCSLFQSISSTMNPSDLFSKFQCSNDDVDKTLAEEEYIFRTELIRPAVTNGRRSEQLPESVATFQAIKRFLLDQIRKKLVFLYLECHYLL